MKNWNMKKQEVTFTFFWQGLKNLWNMFGDKKRIVAYLIALIALVKLITLAIPYCVKMIIDRLPELIESHAVNNSITYMLTALLILLLLNDFIEQIVLEKRFQRFVITMERIWPIMALKKLLELHLEFHEREKTGRTVSKVNKGIDRMVGSLYRFRYDIIPNIFYLILNFAFMFSIHWQVGLIFMTTFFLAAIANICGIKKYSRDWDAWEEQKEKSDGIFVETIYNFKTVMNYAKEKHELDNFIATRDKMKNIDIHACLGVINYFFVFSAVMSIGLLATIWRTIDLAVAGNTGIGSIVFVVATGTNTTRCLWGLLHEYNEVTRHLVATTRLTELLNVEPAIKNGHLVGQPTNSYDLSLKNVAFKYPNKTSPALKKINMNFCHGKMIALVGVSGSGKSTTFKLLNRSYEPTEGSIFLAEKNINDLHLDDYRSLFAIVSQEVDIFDRSIEENVAYANSSASDENINEAIRAASLNIDLANSKKFPAGVKTQVGERGVQLSGGEKQRIGIARAYLALLSGAKFLVLDEATSHLDSLSEKVIQDMVETLGKKMSISIIVCAHRLSTITMSDYIYVMDDGLIVEEGNHERLMKKNGLYCRLIDMQKKGLLKS